MITLNKIIKVKLGEDFYDTHLVLAKYEENNALAVALVESDGCPFATLSINMPFDMDKLGENEFYAQEWSLPDDIIPQLIEQDILELVQPLKQTPSGYIVARAFRLKYVKD